MTQTTECDECHEPQLQSVAISECLTYPHKPVNRDGVKDPRAKELPMTGLLSPPRQVWISEITDTLGGVAVLRGA